MLIRCILSGGSGKRLFPLSTDDQPKQYINFFGAGEHLLKQIVDCKIGESKTVIIASQGDKTRFDEEIAKGLISSEYDIIYEPMRRDTSCAIYTACLHIAKKYGTSCDVVVIPSDNIIDENAITKCIQDSRTHTDSALITFGVMPTGPSTLYGYIEMTDQIPDKDSEGNSTSKLLGVSSFREKPNIELAKEYLATGKYLWNSGIFLSSCRYFLELFETYSINSPDTIETYEKCKSIAFDIDIVEKIRSSRNNSKGHRILVMPYYGRWIDIGNFKSIYENYKKDMVAEGLVKTREVNHSFILNKTDIPVRVIGLRDMIIVLTKDGLLVSDMECSHRIKELI